jgi:hypothetical protein
MNFLKVVGLVLLLPSLPAMASVDAMGIHDVSHVWLDQPTRIGSVVLPAGDCTIRHSIEGEDHGMAFQNASSKIVFKVKCTLVRLGQKASRDQSIFELKSGSERILHELVFRGDTAKHVFSRPSAWFFLNLTLPPNDSKPKPRSPERGRGPRPEG